MDNRFDGCLTTTASGRCIGSKTFFNGRSQNGGLVSLNFGSPFAPTTLSFTFTSFPPFFVVILWLVFVFAASSAAAIFVNVIAASTAIIRIDITFAIAIPIAITSSAPIIAGHRAAKGWRPITTRPEAAIFNKPNTLTKNCCSKHEDYETYKVLPKQPGGGE